MGTWNTGITSNDTAQDLYIEYSAAFYKYEVDEALSVIDSYIRSAMFDETDEEEWCNYYYSLADFMWKKGILTDSVRDRALHMIDTGFGLKLWAEAGQKTLESRKKSLAAFKEKLLSPQPGKKKIKPNVHTERIFEDGDIIAVQLQTKGKPYTEMKERPFSEEEFHRLDGKYVLMQLVNCVADWSSAIVPEVKDYWARFRLFDGVYDTVPDDIDPSKLKDALIHEGREISSVFTCESSLFYFKRRNYKVLFNRKDLLPNNDRDSRVHISMGINKPWLNPDSRIIAAMGKEISCGEFSKEVSVLEHICHFANCYGRFNYHLSREENEARYRAEEKAIAEKINQALLHGGKIYEITFGREVGIVTVQGNHVDNLYIEGEYQLNGFGTKLLAYALSVAGSTAYIDVPKSNEIMRHICDKLGLIKTDETAYTIRMSK